MCKKDYSLTHDDKVFIDNNRLQCIDVLLKMFQQPTDIERHRCICDQRTSPEHIPIFIFCDKKSNKISLLIRVS